MEENKTQEEPQFRINVKQNAKGQAYFDVTVRGCTKEEVSDRLDQAIEIALVKCTTINEVSIK